MDISPVFAETYARYLAAIGEIDLPARADSLGATVTDDALLIPFLGQGYLVSAAGIVDRKGKEIAQSIRVILACYVLRDHAAGGGRQYDTSWRNYRDFRDAAPLVSYFANNCLSVLAAEFSGRVPVLQEAGEVLGGEPTVASGFDLALQFQILPRIVARLNFNDQDELFPAACSVLYRAEAEKFLDMECLAMTGVILAQRLCQVTAQAA